MGQFFPILLPSLCPDGDSDVGWAAVPFPTRPQSEKHTSMKLGDTKELHQSNKQNKTGRAVHVLVWEGFVR